MQQLELFPNDTWRPIESAPRDGTIVLLLVEFEEHNLDDESEASPTIGANSYDHTGEDEWQFAGWCWTYDRFTQGEGKVLGWLPAPQGIKARNGL